MIVATDSGALIGCKDKANLTSLFPTMTDYGAIQAFQLTFLSLKMCLLPFPLVDTFFSEAGALYLVLLSRADLL